MPELRTITTQVSEPLFLEVEKYAQENDRSKSWVLRHALQTFLSQQRSAKQSEQEKDRQFKDELFAMIQEAHDSGEDMNFEPPPRENVWKPNPIVEMIEEMDGSGEKS